MRPRLTKQLISLLVAYTLANGVFAGPILSFRTTTSDPFSICSQLTNSLPKDIREVRKIAKLQRENSESCTKYSGDPPENCVAHLLAFSGLDLTVLSLENKAAPVEITISSSKWNLLGGVKVGQRVEELEKYYGVKIPKNTSPVELMGECAPLIVWHSGGRVTKISLPCHACD